MSEGPKKKYFYSPYPVTREKYVAMLESFINAREGQLAQFKADYERKVERTVKVIADYRLELENIKAPEKAPLLRDINVLL
jgi:hypothetical protein